LIPNDDATSTREANPMTVLGKHLTAHKLLRLAVLLIVAALLLLFLVHSAAS
jgi:hypothetical protein